MFGISRLAKRIYIIALFMAMLLSACLLLGAIGVRVLGAYVSSSVTTYTNGNDEFSPSPNEPTPGVVDSELEPIIICSNGVENDNYGYEIVIQELEVPLSSFENSGIVLFAPWGMNSWALINLILCLLGVMLSAMAAIHALRNKARVTAAKTDDEPFINVLVEDDNSEQPKLLWLTLGLALGIIGMFLFMLTQDMMAPMASFDVWTLAHAAIFFIQATAFYLTIKNEKKEEAVDNGELELST